MKKYILVLFLFSSLVSSAYSQNMQIPQALKSYIALAMNDNPQVQAAEARWRGTDAKVNEAASYLYPKIDVSSRFTAFEGGRVIDIPTIGPVNTAGLGLTPWDTKIEAVWPISERNTSFLATLSAPKSAFVSL